MAHDPVSLCKKLVSIHSESGSEKGIADFIERTAKGAGLKAVRLKNSIVLTPAAPSGKSALILYSHIDTVPPGDISSWKHPPYAGETEAGNLYGLGASDDKGAAACLLSAAIGMKGKKTASDVYYLFAEGEEKDGAGAKNFTGWFSTSGLQKKYGSTWCVVGEPTSLEKMETGCRGSFFVRVHVKGKSYHGADPEKKKDDALSSALLIPAIAAKLEAEGKKQHTHTFLGSPSVSVTGMQAGEKANKLPDTAKVILDVRTTPVFHEKFIGRLEEELKSAGISFTLEISPRQLAPYALDGASPFAAHLSGLTGAKAHPARGSNDCAFFIAAGMGAISFGPGTKECIHKQDEYIPLKQLEKGREAFCMLAEKLKPE